MYLQKVSQNIILYLVSSRYFKRGLSCATLHRPLQLTATMISCAIEVHLLTYLLTKAALHSAAEIRSPLCSVLFFTVSRTLYEHHQGFIDMELLLNQTSAKCQFRLPCSFVINLVINCCRNRRPSELIESSPRRFLSSRRQQHTAHSEIYFNA